MPDIYSRLLLSTGGGIISEQQQAVQEPNIASVMIGLGGTGISAIRTLKTQVYERLRPDDPQALVPTYDHIVFLGIDTDKRSSGIVETNAGRQDKSQDDVSIFPLDETEFFDIGNKDIAGIICNPDIRSRRKELAWINNRIPAPDLTDAGAGGIRQVGRSMLADKSRSFMSKVENALLSAMNGLTGPKVYIHIFAGLSGGTGSGCFLDVCYLVRKILDDKNKSLKKIKNEVKFVIETNQTPGTDKTPDSDKNNNKSSSGNGNKKKESTPVDRQIIANIFHNIVSHPRTLMLPVPGEDKEFPLIARWESVRKGFAEAYSYRYGKHVGELLDAIMELVVKDDVWNKMILNTASDYNEKVDLASIMFENN